METSIEATIQTLRNTLEFVRDQEAREREEKILLHRPRHVELLGLPDHFQDEEPIEQVR